MDHPPTHPTQQAAAPATTTAHAGRLAGRSKRSTGKGGKAGKRRKGGVRPGAGRRADPAKGGRVMLSLEIPAAEAARFRQVARAAGLTQSYLFSTLLSFLSLVENTAQVATTHKEAE